MKRFVNHRTCLSVFVQMAKVSGAKELQMYQKGYLLLFWRLYSVIFEARLALKHHKSPRRSYSRLIAKGSS